MFSERGNDGIERSGEQWFKRHNAKAPEKGGARKSRAAKAGDWLDKTRQAWELTQLGARIEDLRRVIWLVICPLIVLLGAPIFGLLYKALTG